MLRLIDEDHDQQMYINEHQANHLVKLVLIYESLEHKDIFYVCENATMDMVENALLMAGF